VRFWSRSHPGPVAIESRLDRTAIEARLKRLARIYEDGLKTERDVVPLVAQPMIDYLHDAA